MEKNLKGEKFLDRLYKGLHMSDEVMHTAENKDSKAEKINRYMERLERVNKRANKRESSMRNLKYLYHRKYVIKKENLPKYMSDDDKDRIINAQIESMDKWLDYLLDTNAPYPTWAKYWAFQGMLKIGTYDEANDVYQKRSKKTIAPFIETDPEIIAKCIDVVTKYVNSEKIHDEDLEKLIASGNFTKLYTLFIKNKKDNALRTDNMNDGKWITYHYETEEDIKRKKEKGITPEYKKLYNSLQGYNTHWCTAGSEDVAREQICGDDYSYEGGDFHVYYTKDENGDYKIPRLAIRMDKNDIGEIRGVADESQNVEEGFEEIIKDKIKTFKNISNENLEKYIKTINDTRKLTLLNKKNTRNEKFTEKDIEFIYELDNVIEGFGWKKDERIEKIINSRTVKGDYDSLRNKEDKIKFIIKISKMNNFNDNNNNLLIKDKEVIIEAVKENGSALQYASTELKEDKGIVLVAVNQYPGAIKYADKKLCKDEELLSIVLTEKYGRGLKYLTPDLKKDKNIVLKAVGYSGLALHDADESLKKDANVVLAAVEQNGNALAYANKELKDNRKIVLAAVSNKGSALQYASKELKNDKEIVLTAIKNDHSYSSEDRVLRYASKEQRKDKEVVLAAVKKYNDSFTYAADELKKDKDFILQLSREYNIKFSLYSIDNSLAKDEEILLSIIKDYRNSDFIDQKFKKDKDFILKAIKVKPLFIREIDKSLLNDKEFMAEVEKIKEQQEEEKERRMRR
ncbi:MAG: DUF4116 domain-containing protein [Bacilli bacterium]|nr:DUF4116 domain-containing protein [Bacilli bacterium]